MIFVPEKSLKCQKSDLDAKKNVACPTDLYGCLPESRGVIGHNVSVRNDWLREFLFVILFMNGGKTI